MPMLSGGASQGASASEGSSGDDTNAGGSTGGDGASMSASESDTTSSTEPGAESSGDATMTAPTTDDTSGGDTEVDSLGETSSTGGDSESSSSGSTGGALQDGVLDIRIFAYNDCTFTTQPASITVPEGTAFTVNWINDPSSEVEVDVAKMNPTPNHVPIIIGMEVGTSYHDEVREWCGNLFTGTFDFRVTSCFDPHYIPVDCGG